jgi:DNA-binding MarR family transcriptional regulator
VTLLDAIRRATFALENMYSLAGAELSPTQFQFLQSLGASNGLSQREIAQNAGIDRSSASDVARRLTKDGLITRERDSSDTRAWLVHMTPKGREALKRTNRIMAEIEDTIAASGVNIDTLTTRLTQVERLRPPPPPPPIPRTTARRRARSQHSARQS